MNSALSLTRLPRPFDPDRGAEARALFTLFGDMADLVEGAGGSSPYLFSLMQKEAAWIAAALNDPDAALAAEFDRLRGVDPAQIGPALRQGKRRVALLIALADLGGAWPLEQVTGTLTDFADLATALALRAALEPELRRGKLPGMDLSALDEGAGMVVMAMGKMGAGELNYSSDIDLIVLYDETRFDPDQFLDARPAYIRATRKMAATLSEITGEGYVFRTDLRLRPDPSVTPVALGMEAAERYYESLGRTWERAAWIKARPCAGDIAGGERFIDTLRPFVWRRHLDYAAIQDAHDVRLAIRKDKGYGGAIDLSGHDMKLGRGGIREIEFFAQFHQIVAGGRDPALRVRGTVEALSTLADRDWLPRDTADTLAEHYRFHRDIEHRVQMIQDQQTHSLPTGAEGLGRVAALMGRSEDDLGQEIRARLNDVHSVTEAFFAPDTGKAEEPDVEFDEEILSRWHAYPALSSSRARQIFDRLRPHLLAAFARAAKPDEALAAFDGFLRGLPAGVQVFSLLDNNPQLIDLLGDIAGTAPDLALYLSRNSAVFEAVIGGGFFEDWPGVEVLCKSLLRALQREEDYERRLDALRRAQKEWHFRIGVHHLRGLVTAEEAGQHYAELAEAILRILWPEVQREFAAKYGDPPGRGAVVLGMGSLGAGRLNARSDLDIIVIYDAAGVDASDGPKPLDSRSYYARLTQALVTALSAPMAEGRLYEVDMRLRPSGNQGPVATSWPAFCDYQTTRAWTWEHLALTRSRVLAGPEELASDVGSFIADLLARGREASDVLSDVAEMRARLHQAKGAGTLWEVKAGRGRNQEIELLAQAGGLIAGDPRGWILDGLRLATESGWLAQDAAAHLGATWRLLWQIGQVGKLLNAGTLDPDAIGEGGRSLLLRDTGEDSIEALAARVAAATDRAGREIDKALKAAEEGRNA